MLEGDKLVHADDARRRKVLPERVAAPDGPHAHPRMRDGEQVRLGDPRPRGLLGEGVAVDEARLHEVEEKPFGGVGHQRAHALAVRRGGVALWEEHQGVQLGVEGEALEDQQAEVAQEVVRVDVADGVFHGGKRAEQEIVRRMRGRRRF